jgi:hypothetical protein
MGSRNNTPWRKKDAADTIFDLMLDEGVQDLAKIAEGTEIAYFKEYEEEAMEYIKNQGKYMGISTGYEGLDLC